MARKVLAFMVVALTASTVAQASVSLMAGPVGNEVVWDETDPGTTLYMVNSTTGVIDWEGEKTMMGIWQATWDLTLDPDPIVSGVITLTNMMASSQSFTYNVVLPVVGAYPTGSPKNGSSTISLLDANFDSSASLDALAGDFVYDALIDGNIENQLFPEVVAGDLLSVSTLGGVDQVTDSFSGVTSQNLTSTMAISHQFVLSSGDKASINSTFQVLPEPASIALLGLGAMGLARRSQR